MIDFASEESSRRVSGAVCHGHPAHENSSRRDANRAAALSITTAAAFEPMEESANASRAITYRRDRC